jgi:ADP-ribose pyrophosphatase YjhB (NUDIX family)
MPLLPGKTNIGSNIEEMQAAGHPHDQAVAAALNVARTHRENGGPTGALLGSAPFVPGASSIAPTDNPNRLLFNATGQGRVTGIISPRHMWEGNATTGAAGMRDINKARAKVYGPENRDPLNVGKVAAIHRDTLAQHFAKPLAQQTADEEAALGRLRAAKHIAKEANTLDESEKTDTVKYEHDSQGRNYEPWTSKGTAGHALYTSGTGLNQRFHVLNTCPGQTAGCSGGLDAQGHADTSKGTCFAPVQERMYPNAAIRRAAHEQAKFDPAMTRDWILAHTGSLREAAEKADKNNHVVLFRPNVVDESDRSSRYAVRGLNAQRQAAGLPNIIGNSYSKAGELNDPANGWYVTHSNVGPKTKLGASIRENIGRDAKRVRETITAQDAAGNDIRNEQGQATPPMGSYMVTDVSRDTPLDAQTQAAIKTAKYWGVGHAPSATEQAEGQEAHYNGAGMPTTPEQAHYGHTTLNGLRYDYQKQHVLHPRLVEVGKNDDGSPHIIPTDSRFKDEDYLPKERFMSRSGKPAGPILLTTPTTSTKGQRDETGFTHHIDPAILAKAIANHGEHEIDSPAEQAASAGREYVAPKPVKTKFKLARGGAAVGDDEHNLAFPETCEIAQRHLAHRNDAADEAEFRSGWGYADGGGPGDYSISTTSPGMFHTGPIHAAVAGRTDHLPMTVASGSYVLPADIVSAGGEGNTLAGFKVLRRTFGGEPYGQSGSPYGQTGGVYGLPVSYAKGGAVKAAGVLFVSPEKQILLMRRKGADHAGEWSVPGGHVEAGERPETAAKREVREETGHEHKGGLSPFLHTDSGKVAFTTFLAQARDEFTPTLNDEHDQAKWVSIDEAESLPLHPGVRAALAKLEARVRKAGGGTASGVPIVAAGGEWVISPEQVRGVGRGDLDAGHRALDEFVKRVREELIGTLQKLPGPRRD